MHGFTVGMYPPAVQDEAHVMGNTIPVDGCDEGLGLLFGKERGVHVCEARSCEQGGVGRSRALWEPRLVE